MDELSFERFMAVFGTCTGTGASGLLLRIEDPEFKTPAAQELGLMNVFLLLLMPIAFILYPLPKIGLMYGILASTGVTILCLILLWFFKFWGKSTWS